MSGWARVLKSRVLAGCHALACPGERALEYIYAFRPQARALPVLLLPNLVDSSVFERTVSELRGRRAAIRAELGIAPHEQLLLGMGRMVDYKGFGQVVEAAAHVPGDYKIIFLGDGERLAAWRARVAELKLSQRIRFDGQKPESEVARHLAAADWFLHPALEDPSPLVTIEAATAGLPVAVANQTGNAPETVVHNESGYRFDAVNITEISQTLEKMVNMDEGTRRSFGARSAELARENFSPDKVADRFFRELPTLSRMSGAPETQSQA
jgi:glycosyltransferase involved in cell wall biosynthesis